MLFFHFLHGVTKHVLGNFRSGQGLLVLHDVVASFTQHVLSGFGSVASGAESFGDPTLGQSVALLHFKEGCGEASESVGVEIGSVCVHERQVKAEQCVHGSDFHASVHVVAVATNGFVDEGHVLGANFDAVVFRDEFTDGSVGFQGGIKPMVKEALASSNGSGVRVVADDVEIGNVFKFGNVRVKGVNGVGEPSNVHDVVRLKDLFE